MKLKQIAPNLTGVEIGNNLTVYFSYETPVAFSFNGRVTGSENIWSQTTGKHLNMIPGNVEENRVSFDVFERSLNQLLTC